MQVETFRIAVDDADVADLHRRLLATRAPGGIAGAGWRYGADPDYMRRLLASWADTYSWRDEERALNEIPQYRAVVDGLGVHFVHAAGVGPRPLPLVLTHGWPSSFVEWRDVVGPLTDPGRYGGDPADAFTLVAPSLPGYGFSDVPDRPGCSPRRIAALWRSLMVSLGHGRFATAGCDWGAYVSALLGLDHPEHVVGVHMGMVTMTGRPATVPDGHPTEPADAGERDEAMAAAEEAAYRRRVSDWREHEHGYIALQATKPQTLAYGLADSPAGLAAWIAEKWWAWADCGDDLHSVISMDTLLTTISLYWYTGTINSANRLYFEGRHDPVRLAPGERVEVPCGFLLEAPTVRHAVPRRNVAAAAMRPGGPPRRRAELAYNVQRWTEAPSGGHFPALETPELFVAELRAFFRPLRDG